MKRKIDDISNGITNPELPATKKGKQKQEDTTTFPEFCGDKETADTINYTGPGEYTIYPVNGLMSLIDKVKIKNQQLNEIKKEVGYKIKDKHFKIRFVLLPNFELRFAEEGAGSPEVPHHYRITGECAENALAISAGNISFNLQGDIAYVSNKSGNFEPTIESLDPVFAILFGANISFAPEISMEGFNRVSGNTSIETIDTKGLQERIEAKFTKEQRDAWNELNTALQPKMIKYFGFYKAKKLNQMPDQVEEKQIEKGDYIAFFPKNNSVYVTYCKNKRCIESRVTDQDILNLIDDMGENSIVDKGQLEKISNYLKSNNVEPQIAAGARPFFGANQADRNRTLNKVKELNFVDYYDTGSSDDDKQKENKEETINTVRTRLF